MRLLQGMLVAHYEGNGISNALEVFGIPESEHDSFFKWLKTTDNKMFQLLKHTKGFVKLGNRKTLSTLAEHYKAIDSSTQIGWNTVPMQSNSIVLWVGPHRVQHAKRKHDQNSYRSVLYLNLQDRPPQEELPESLHSERFTNHTQGKQVNSSLEHALCSLYQQQQKPYGWNKDTIPERYHKWFASSNSLPVVHPTSKQKTNLYMDHLRQKGFVVIPNVLAEHDAQELHRVITECARTLLFRVPRVGMCSTLQQDVLSWSLHRFASQLNSRPLKKARYFKRNTPDVFCGYDKSDTDSRKMCNLQGVQGITLSSQMIDIYSHPFFAYCLIQIYPVLKTIFNNKTFYFGKERCSLRSYGSAPLETHIDEPISKLTHF